MGRIVARDDDRATIGADRFLVAALALLAVLIVAPVALAIVYWPTFHGPWVGDGLDPVWWLVGWLLLVSVAVVTVLVAARTMDSSTDDPAIEELRVAYARGEVDDEEYEKRYERLRDD
ncbi:MAG: SHOCT domain-containing protein [Halobacteriota archaeon]